MKQHSSIVSPRTSPLEAYRRDLERCVKCGACRAVCPTFLREREESRSARGRMALVKALVEGKLAASDIFKDRLASCTGCLACEHACPSGVPAARIIQAAKEQAVAESGTGIVSVMLSSVLKRPALFRSVAWLAPVVLHYSRISECGMRDAEFRPGSGLRGVRNEMRRDGAAKGRIAFFPGCAVSYFQQELGTAAVRVLDKLGYEAVVPDGLKCCGRPLLSLGDRRTAEDLARHNAAVLSGVKADTVVTACASCALTFKREYPTLLEHGADAPEVLDIHEFLSLRVPGHQLGSVNKLITWHDPCHLGRGLGLSRAARGILRSIPGVAFSEMRDADRCCGFGGVMRITHRGLSDGIAREKARSIMATGATTVVTGCPACRMQIENALATAGYECEVLHTVQLLDEALSIGDCGSPIADGACAGSTR